MEHIFGKRKWVSRMEEMIESQKQQNNKNKSESSSSNNDTVSEQAEETADEEYSSEPTESENLPDKE